MEATSDYEGRVRSIETEEATVWIQDTYKAADSRFGPEYCGERYNVMFEPAFSDVSSRVPNGDFDDLNAATEYMCDVVVDDGEIVF